MKQVFLTLDPALSTGYAVAEVENKTCTIIDYGFIDVDQSSQYEGDWMIDLQNRISKLHAQYNFSDVAVEDYFFSSRFKSGSNVNPYFRAAIHMWSRQNGLPYSILNISNWKVFIATRSTPTKIQKLKWGKEPAKKLMIAQALYQRFDIKLPNHSISEKTGKPIQFRYDVSDAIGQALYHAYSKYGCTTFISSVVNPPDIPMKKTKKTFSYDDLV